MLKSFYKSNWWFGHARLAHSTTKIKRNNENIKEIEEVFKEGSEIEGFLVNKVSPVPEFDMTMIRLRHLHTGCDYLHLARQDNNNVFSICFRTTPLDSTGTPHVLEHMVLCGSLKYPCRDPHFKMSGRSMATFMNAMTGPDYTLYPFATQNKSDYKNLLSVYMDAAFNPQLRELDFRQEGWRFEHEDPQNRESPIVIKGVVFNEMKGVFSNTNTLFSHAILNNLLPSHTYGVVSGGDPKYIPSLTHSDIKAFHKKYYHPSNCKLYSYGNFPLIPTLQFINKEYLADYPDTSDYAKCTKVPSEPRWENEKRKHISCKPDSLSPNPKKQSAIGISTLCGDIKHSSEIFTMQVISELLINGSNSAFYKTFLDANISSGFASVTGYDAQTRDTLFTLGLLGVDANHFDNIIELYHKTLDNVILNGFNSDDVNAVLHTVELLTRHQTANFGLDMLFYITPTWNHDGEVLDSISISGKVTKFIKCISDNPSYLQEKLEEYLKRNQHRLILTMSPDEDFDLNTRSADNEIIAEYTNLLTPSVRDSIYDLGIDSNKDCEIMDDCRCLPKIAVRDIALDVERATLKGYCIQKIPVQVCNVPTNGICYLRGVLNTSILSEEAKSLLPLFCAIATKMGTNSTDYQKLNQLIHLKTGRLTCAPHIAENIYDMLSYEEGITFSSMCLDRNVKCMMDLWADIFNSVNFTDVKRFRSVVKESAESVFQNLTLSADLYAISVGSAIISPSAERKEQFGGLQYIRQMKELSSKVNMMDALEIMKGIADIIFKKRLIRIAVNCSLEAEENMLLSIERFLQTVPGEFKSAYEISKSTVKKGPINSSFYFNIPSQVSFTAHCLRTVAYTHPDFPILRLAARLLTTKYCTPNIRDKSGAYSTSANISTSGTLSMSSYRDPNPSLTFDTFKNAKNWLLSGKDYSANDIEESKLGVFQSIDGPVPVGSTGVRNFLFGISDDELQRHRKTIMAATKADVMRVAEYINTEYQARCLIGPKNVEVIRRHDEHWQERFIK